MLATYSMQYLDKIVFGEFILMMAEMGLSGFSIEQGEISVNVDMKPKGYHQFPIFAIEMREGEEIMVSVR